jgi:hypothetical protein
MSKDAKGLNRTEARRAFYRGATVVRELARHTVPGGELGLVVHASERRRRGSGRP